MPLFEHVPHPRIAQRSGAPKVADAHRTGSAYARFNKALAVLTTNAVGSMTCAYLFAALALVSLPSVLSSHSVVEIVAWVAQTFFQLVLLSVIIVGQNVQAEASDARSDATYQDAEAVLHECIQLQAHLAAQDARLDAIVAHFGIPTSPTSEGS